VQNVRLGFINTFLKHRVSKRKKHLVSKPEGFLRTEVKW
jgi:hypothetical protein